MNSYGNFHGSIAVELEDYAKRFIAPECFSADAIEGGNFVATMALILQNTVDAQVALAFSEKSSQYLGKSASRISYEIASKLFDEFKQHIKDAGVEF